MSDWPGVFVSSTCYDLMDLRAELEVSIRELGLIPVMSDRPSSEFEVAGDAESITTCLQNVKKCPIFVGILSNRYGPRLGSSGFDNVSATHLEFNAARSTQPRPRILVYVRDRLFAEYSISQREDGLGARSAPASTQCADRSGHDWKIAVRHAARTNAPLQLPKFAWLKDERDHGLFELLQEHETLVAAGEPNWFWTFRDSVDLKQRLALDLGAVSRRAVLQRLIDTERVPFFAINSTSMSITGPTLDLTLAVRNLTKVVALKGQLFS